MAAMIEESHEKAKIMRSHKAHRWFRSQCIGNAEENRHQDNTSATIAFGYRHTER